ncbi:hypothetical protein COX11_02630 [Candidatus Berkelbacteria bacterium CG23_combo_of_CG06-09_8_20_14_all_41_73]|uniref:Uncharacterized protein n=3 Tax=Candidatus Berkelbacteria TaxID=1618330 RepID=A0A2H0AZA2_9BACT|nr:MAG: hypothetical protein COX11_02630 [Candidatus Berkelbacteria bacterium CG23_combo_of_CG06-09_8_20_14_all_41_73]PIR27370.1 MAG: hypothetical protein COV40_01240 [Candidatus Berkelbacteria bacterium CG11_big_fil_rev_8_21_14_0_20_42_15]PIZ27704.1 MAG: hypothetical protein COY45_01040 [Candidatus Berkelbacteria bacterium CG_4_10_14_0_8_um_filter_42_34]
MIMSKQKIILIFVILLLIAGNIFLGYKYFTEEKQLKQIQISSETQKFNDKILDFSKLFIQKVLKAQNEVDFETRLKLENAVRNLGDDEILNQWEKFTGSKTETEAQDNVKQLLELLVNKIKVQ